MVVPPLPIKDAAADIVGKMAGEYRLRRKLGEGGFGAVYEAEHPLLKRRAAVKVLHRIAGKDSEAILRFVAEAQAASQIRSRHILDVFSFGQLVDGRHFYVMDLLDGEPLDRYLQRVGRVDVPTAIQILRAVAEALDAAHVAGIVHRDLKPQNVFLACDADGATVPKLLDFGLAKLVARSSPINTMDGMPMGTPLYMSPEQARGEAVDARADVYALGVVCHELLTGTLPITGESTLAVLMGQIMAHPPRVSEVCPDLASGLDEPILRMLDKSAPARPATAGGALAALAQAAERAGHIIPSGMPRLGRPPAQVGDPGLPDPGQSLSESPWVVSTLNAATPGAPPGRAPRRASLPAVAGLAGLLILLILLILGGAVYVGAGRGAGQGADQGAGQIEGRVALAPARIGVPPSAPAPRPSVPVSPRVSPGVASAPPPDPSAARPGSIDLTVRGAPRGARIWRDGKALGEAAGPVALPFGQAPLQFVITASGYESATLVVVPNQPLAPTIRLTRRSPGAPANVSIPRDLESPF